MKCLHGRERSLPLMQTLSRKALNAHWHKVTDFALFLANHHRHVIKVLFACIHESICNCNLLVFSFRLMQRRRSAADESEHVGVDIRVLLNAFCSNTHRTWQECSQLLFSPTKLEALWTSSQNRSHVLLLQLGPPVAFKRFKMLNSCCWSCFLTEYTHVLSAYTVMEFNVIMILKWSVILWPVTHFWV